MNMLNQQVKIKPKRRCVGCRNMFNKNDLIRLVCDKNILIVDKSGKTEGRGVYVCKNLNCILIAQKNKGLERSIKRKVSPETYVKLRLEVER